MILAKAAGYPGNVVHLRRQAGLAAHAGRLLAMISEAEAGPRRPGAVRAPA